MKVQKNVKIDLELEITGATLLSIEEERVLPVRLRQYDNWWWLRSPGCNQTCAAGVNILGDVHEYGGTVDNGDGAVRPALIINLESSNLEIGDVFIFGDKEFEIISDKLAFCKSDIGCHYFRRDWKAKDVNVYEVSDIKKFVDDWFTRTITTQQND